jgi:hypothetical protein
LCQSLRIYGRAGFKIECILETEPIVFEKRDSVMNNSRFTVADRSVWRGERMIDLSWRDQASHRVFEDFKAPSSA